MKRTLLFLLLMPMLVHGQTVGKVSASITAGCELTEVQSCYFSNMTIIGQCTVTMLHSGERTSTGTVQFSDEYNAPGKFMVSGSPLSTYKVVFGVPSAFTNGKTNATISALKTSLVNGIGTLDGTGKGFFNVGMTLSFLAGSTSGIYNGTYNVTAASE